MRLAGQLRKRTVDEQGGVTAIVHQQVGAVTLGPGQRLDGSQQRGWG